jgi:hypothetical protein
MSKVDYKKEMKEMYSSSSKTVSVVDVPPMMFLMIDGQGDPNTSQSYREAVEALFTVSYTLKFMVKKQKSVDYAVMPLEGLWWSDNMADFTSGRKDQWKWTAMIMEPQIVTAEDVKAAIAQAKKKKNLASIDKLRFECFSEGKAAQILHLGPYAAEGANIAKIHAFIQSSGHSLSGKHHEIYLSDPSRAAPEKLKTILRQPMT